MRHGDADILKQSFQGLKQKQKLRKQKLGNGEWGVAAAGLSDTAELLCRGCYI